MRNTVPKTKKGIENNYQIERFLSRFGHTVTKEYFT